MQAYQVGEARDLLEPVEKNTDASVVSRLHGDGNRINKLVRILGHADSLHRFATFHSCLSRRAYGLFEGSSAWLLRRPRCVDDLVRAISRIHGRHLGASRN
ncbi:MULTISPECIES: hypothetical protein [unclassified Streptomyces]|uniref:hypothetical protein n=1 Tax=unclassified Streptomyces TaxID=2593676 RepID=UPI00324E091F